MLNSAVTAIPSKTTCHVALRMLGIEQIGVRRGALPPRFWTIKDNVYVCSESGFVRESPEAERGLCTV